MITEKKTKLIEKDTSIDESKKDVIDNVLVDSLMEQFMKLSLNEVVLIGAKMKQHIEEQGAGYLLSSTSSSANAEPVKEEKEEKAMIRLKKIPSILKDKIEFIKLLSAKMSWPLNQAKGSIEVLPLILKEVTTLDDANALKNELSTISEVEIEIEIL